MWSSVDVISAKDRRGFKWGQNSWRLFQSLVDWVFNFMHSPENLKYSTQAPPPPYVSPRPSSSEEVFYIFMWASLPHADEPPSALDTIYQRSHLHLSLHNIKVNDKRFPFMLNHFQSLNQTKNKKISLYRFVTHFMYSYNNKTNEKC